MNSIYTRRSVRTFNDKPVDDIIVEKLLRSAMQAPSAGNGQPWEFIVVKNKAMLSKLAGSAPYSGPVEQCAVAIVVVGDESKSKFPAMMDQDLSAATQNILLEAVNNDLGSVWIGVSPIEERIKYVRELFNLPEGIKPFNIIAIGYPSEKGNVFVERFDLSKIHNEVY